ncbi:MAG: D-hexose-6-phosphate mutarotase [Campylobacteraceae bacterium]|nr:D-hexose-6-phosphate mutarotase [Campylobacteraceae bacterium]
MKDILEIEHPYFSAKVLLQGAQLIHFQLKDRLPLLWSTDLCFYEEGKPFRGGIPLCWPWFGKVQEPFHGFARVSKWKLLQRVDTSEHVILEFGLTSDMVKVPYWIYPFELKMKMILGKKVFLELHVNSEVETTAALHTYFWTEDIEMTELGGLSYEYFDSLTQSKVLSDLNVLKIDRTVDRIYNYSEKHTITRSTNSIEVYHHNASDIVVWNPWREGAKKLVDMENEQYKHMLCLETARISKPIKNEKLSLTIEQKG